MKKFLKCMPHAQAFVEESADGTRTLTSYKTEAATISADGILTIKCWCSPTTRRHVVAFVDEYVHGLQSKAEQNALNLQTYQTCKALFEGHMAMDVTTGEVIDIGEEA